MSGGLPRVDVAVVTWNTRDLTVRALRRLLDTGQGAQLRLLVHDNGSTDGTAEAIRVAVPEADVVAAPTNGGFAAGVNALLARSQAPWVLLLNSDAWPQPGAVGELVACAERHPRAAVVAPRLESETGELEQSTHPFPSVGVAARAPFTPFAWPHDEERAVDWAIGAALLLRRSAAADVGEFDESFFMYAEDLEWCHRARSHGWEVWFTPAAVVVHVGNASGSQRYADRDAAVLASQYAFYRRHHRAAGVAAYRAVNAAGAALAAGRALSRRDRDRARYWWRQLPKHLGRS